MQFLAVRQLSVTSVQADYRAFYTAGVLLRAAPTDLYDFAAQTTLQNRLISLARFSLPYYHLPYEVLLYAPFTLLPYWASYRCFLLFNSLLLVPIVLALPELATDRLPLLRRYPAVALFLFVPVLIALVQGQDSIVFLLLCSLAWRAWKGERDLLCGCLLGLGLFRFQLVLPLLLLLWWRRRTRTLLLSVGVTAVGLLALSWTMVGTAGLRAMASLVSLSSLAHDHGSGLQDAIGVHPLAMPNLFGLLYRLWFSHLPDRWLAMVTAAVSLVVFVYAARRVTAVCSDGATFALALLCSLLVSLHLSMHDLSLLPLALVLLRTRAALLLGIATYLLAVLLLFVGAESFWLLAVPMLSLALLPTEPGGFDAQRRWVAHVSNRRGA